MSRIVCLLLGVALAWSGGPRVAGAQLTPDLSSQRPPVEFGVAPVAQRVNDDGNTLIAYSSRVWLSLPVGASTRLWMQTTAASVDATNVPRVNGLGDAQVGLAHVRPVGASSLHLSLASNLPSGQTELTPDELNTAILMSQGFYGLQMNTFGQGWSVAPAATLVVPVSETVALGFGATYRYLDAYTPVVDETGDVGVEYEPGNEVLLALGVDVKITPTSAWSFDASYTFFGTDRQNDADVFEAGNRVALTTQYLSATRYQQVRAVLRFDGRARSTLQPPGGGSAASASDLRSVPQRGLARVDYTTRLGARLSLGLRGEGWIYGATDREALRDPSDAPEAPPLWTLSDAQTLARGAVSLPVDLSPTVRVTPRVAGTVGTFAGVEGGLALRWRR